MFRMKKIGLIIAALVVTMNVSTISAKAQEVPNQLSNETKVEMKKLMAQEEANVIKKTKALEESLKNTRNYFSDFKGEQGIQTATVGTYPTRTGVILVTTDNSTLGIQHGHAGILWNSTTTVEAMTDGVMRMPNTWNTYYNTVYGVTPGSTTSTQDTQAANWCDGQVGKPYNYNFFNTSTRNSFYCSHLVWAAYKDLFSVNLDDDGGIIWPVDLVNSSKTNMIYQK